MRSQLFGKSIKGVLVIGIWAAAGLMHGLPRISELSVQQGPEPSPTPQPSESYIQINPSSGTFAVGGVIDVTIEISTAGSAIRGGGIILLYDPLDLSPVDGTGNLAKEPDSPFQLSPPPDFSTGRIQVTLLEPSFIPVAYSGTILSIQFLCLRSNATVALGFDETTTRFAPEVEGTILQAATYTLIDATIEATATPCVPLQDVADLNCTGCTDVDDFHLLMDNWETEINGVFVGMLEFLNLLDHWNEGCV